MYGQASPRSSRHDGGGVTGLQLGMSHSQAGVGPQTVQVKGPIGVRTNPTAAGVLSPGRSRRHHRAAGGNHQGNRSGSPLTLPPMPMDTGYGVGSGDLNRSTYLGDTLATGHSPVPSPGSGRSPYQSPAHSRSSSMTSVKSLLRDRSMERGGDREHLSHHGHHPHHQGGMLIRDRSLDRQLDRHYRDSDSIHHTFGGRDRSLDREYPHMGARSLDRDGHHPIRHGNLVRSRSIDHEYMANQAAFMPSPDLRYARDTLILDLQGSIAELNKECATYQQDLDATKEKLSSSMNSIKTFWSPELKKERALRKEETAKMSGIFEQYRVSKATNEKHLTTIRQLEEEVLAYKSCHHKQGGPGDYDSIHRDKQKAAREVSILRKTVEEMELRIDTQKQTLVAREESIKKLLEMLQSKGLAVKHLEEDRHETERLQTRVLEEQRRTKQLEAILEHRDQEVAQLKEELMKKQDVARHAQMEVDKMRREAGTEALQAMIESKDMHVNSLEMEVKLLEDELLRLREEGTINGHDARNGNLETETLRSQEKLLKAKIENLKAELGRKDTELCGLRAQVESLQRQGSDHQQHIMVLREQITAKDQQASMIQADLDLMRDRLEEKDGVIEKKGKQILHVQGDRKRVEGELAEVRDHMDIKERKINVLIRKIENLEELVRDKETQVSAMKQRLNSIHADHNSSDSTVTALEDALNDKEKQIERLKDQRDRVEREHSEEMELLQRANKEHKAKIDSLCTELDEKQNSVLEMREEASEMRAEKMRRDTRISQLELAMSQKSADIQQLSDQIKKLEDEKAVVLSRSSQETEARTADLENELRTHKEATAKTQTEVDRLLEILQQMEVEKHEKDRQIKELQEQVKESKTKAGSLRRSQQTEKKKSAQMLEEARKREEEVSEDISQLKNVIKQKMERIEELEEALRESVKITAQREMVMAEQHMKIEDTEKQMKVVTEELENIEREGREKNRTISNLNDELETKEGKVKTMQVEHRKHLEGLYEMKQEAIVAAISEKDAHIALLEMAPGPKPVASTDEVDRLNKEKNKLQSQLKELTQSRMKLLQNEETNGSAVVKSLTNAPPEQVVQAIRGMEYSKKRLRALIDQLVATCLDIDPQLLEGLPRLQQDLAASHCQLRRLGDTQLLQELGKCERDCNRLQDYINTLLQRIRAAQPDKLFAIMEWLDRAVQR